MLFPKRCNAAGLKHRRLPAVHTHGSTTTWGLGYRTRRHTRHIPVIVKFEGFYTGETTRTSIHRFAPISIPTQDLPSNKIQVQGPEVRGRVGDPLKDLKDFRFMHFAIANCVLSANVHGAERTRRNQRLQMRQGRFRQFKGLFIVAFPPPHGQTTSLLQSRFMSLTRSDWSQKGAQQKAGRGSPPRKARPIIAVRF
jgi:hypothetical protein